MNLPKEAKDLYSENYKTLMKEIIVVLIFISLIISDVEHFFMRLLAIWMSSLEKRQAFILNMVAIVDLNTCWNF